MQFKSSSDSIRFYICTHTLNNFSAVSVTWYNIWQGIVYFKFDKLVWGNLRLKKSHSLINFFNYFLLTQFSGWSGIWPYRRRNFVNGGAGEGRGRTLLIVLTKHIYTKMYCILSIYLAILAIKLGLKVIRKQAK